MHPPSFHHYILVHIPDFNKISIQKNVVYSILTTKAPSTDDPLAWTWLLVRRPPPPGTRPRRDVRRFSPRVPFEKQNTRGHRKTLRLPTAKRQPWRLANVTECRECKECKECKLSFEGTEHECSNCFIKTKDVFVLFVLTSCLNENFKRVARLHHVAPPWSWRTTQLQDLPIGTTKRHLGQKVRPSWPRKIEILKRIESNESNKRTRLTRCQVIPTNNKIEIQFQYSTDVFRWFLPLGVPRLQASRYRFIVCGSQLPLEVQWIGRRPLLPRPMDSQEDLNIPKKKGFKATQEPHNSDSSPWQTPKWPEVCSSLAFRLCGVPGAHCIHHMTLHHSNGLYPSWSMGFAGLLAIIVWTTQSNLRN